MARILHWVPAYNHTVNVALVQQIRLDTIYAIAGKHQHDFVSMHSCDLVWSRNDALHKAIVGGYDLLMMQDADCFSPAPTGPLLPMMESLQKTGATVVGAAVPLRTRPPKMNVHPWRIDDVYECDKIGTGIVLIDLAKVREWYDDFDGPCFWRTYEGTAGVGKGTVQAVGLDIWFTRDVVRRLHGGKVVCDSRVDTVHVDGTHQISYIVAEATKPDTADSVERTEAPISGNDETDRTDTREGSKCQ